MARTKQQQQIEVMYQRAMNLRDSTWQSIDMTPIENEYQSQYMRAFRVTGDVDTFRRQTREYRALLRSYKKNTLSEVRDE